MRFSNPKLVGTLHFDGFLTFRIFPVSFYILTRIQLSNTSIFYSTSRPLSFVCSVLSLLNNSSRPHHHKVVATFLSQSHYWLCPTTKQTHYSISLNLAKYSISGKKLTWVNLRIREYTLILAPKFRYVQKLNFVKIEFLDKNSTFRTVCIRATCCYINALSLSLPAFCFTTRTRVRYGSTRKARTTLQQWARGLQSESFSSP